MKNSDKRLNYATSDCSFSIDISKQDYVSVQLYDKKGRKASLMITNDVLKPSFMNIDELKEHIYKQVIHEGSFAKEMLRLDQDMIIMMFNYPKCKVKTLSFSVEWKQPQQHTKSIKCTAKYVQQLIENVEDRLTSLERQMEARMNQKLASIISLLENKYKEIRKRLNHQVQQKISMATARIQQYQNQNQNIAQRCLLQNCRKLKDSNLRYFDEFRLIKTDLETSLINCNLNIRELSQQISDIHAFVMNNHGKTEEKVDKFAFDMQDLERTFRFSFKHINDRLISLQQSQKLLGEKKFLNEQTAQQEVLRVIQIPHIIRNSENKEIQEEQTTFMPILSQQELKVTPNQETIFLED